MSATGGPRSLERDWARFTAQWEQRGESECRIWTGALMAETGYGAFWAEGRTWGAHRWVFRNRFGYLPRVVMHRCDVHACVNWEGCMIAGDQKTNMQDCSTKGRWRNQFASGPNNTRR